MLLIFHLSQINSFTLAKIQSDKKRSIMRNFSLKIKDSYIGENKVDNRVFCYRYPIRTKKLIMVSAENTNVLISVITRKILKEGNPEKAYIPST